MDLTLSAYVVPEGVNPDTMASSSLVWDWIFSLSRVSERNSDAIPVAL